MRPPIVVNEHGDVSAFASVADAARKLEPVDVQNNEFVAYDSDGYRLALVVHEHVVSIPGPMLGPPSPAELEEVLRSFAQEVGSPLPESNSLQDLVGHFVRQFGYTL